MNKGEWFMGLLERSYDSCFRLFLLCTMIIIKLFYCSNTCLFNSILNNKEYLKPKQWEKLTDQPKELEFFKNYLKNCIDSELWYQSKIFLIFF